MAAPSQPIAKFDELNTYLLECMMEDTPRHHQELTECMNSADYTYEKYHALVVQFREKWLVMDKLIASNKSHMVSKATLKAIRDIIGNELDQYL